MFRKIVPEPTTIHSGVMIVTGSCTAGVLAHQSCAVPFHQSEEAILREFMKEGKSLPSAGQPAGVPV